MTDNEPDILDVEGAPIGTTGKQLRSAREAKGWDVNSLSESLHLRPAVLIAIESGEYREVPELFLKGYVRSYARLVGLEGDPLIRQLESELQPLREEEAERRVESPIFHIEVKKRKKQRIAFWVLLLALAALVVFGFIRFQGLGYDLGFGTLQEDTAGEPEQDVEEISEDTFLAPPENIELVGEETDDPVLEDGLSPGTGTDAQGIPPAGDDPAPTALPEVTTSPAPPMPEREEVTPAPAEPPAADAEVAEPVTEPTVEQNVEPEPEVAAPAEAPSARQVSFSIEFDGDCWIEVRNGEGERVFAGLQGAGDQLSLTALPPVSFVLGNIDGIASFTFDGETIDVGDYPSRNGRSQFTLSENSGN